MPGLLDVDFRRNHSREDHPADLVFCDRFNGDAKAATMIAVGWFHALNRRIANEASEFCRANVWIAKRLVEADDPTDWNSCRGLIVDANGGSVANVGAISCAARESIACDCISSSKQPVVFSSGDVESIAWFHASGHYSIPNALKFAAG
jgi:hypothetical protein